MGAALMEPVVRTYTHYCLTNMKETYQSNAATSDTSDTPIPLLDLASAKRLRYGRKNVMTKRREKT